MIPTRRRFLATGLALLAAPAIVRVGSIMPVRVIEPAVAELALFDWREDDLIRTYWVRDAGTGEWRHVIERIPASEWRR